MTVEELERGQNHFIFLVVGIDYAVEFWKLCCA